MAKDSASVSFKVLKEYTSDFKNYNNELFVSKETGKELSTNDFTNAYKGKLDIALTAEDIETEPIDWEKEV